MAITLSEPTIKKEKRKTADGTDYEVFCVCVWVENDSDNNVKGDISFWAVAPGALTPIRGVLCTKSDVTIPKKKVKKNAAGAVIAEAKGREEVCCCANEAIIEVFNNRGHITAAWGKKDKNGEVTIGKAEETKKTSKAIQLPP
jgi:hypothetical protein